MDLKTARDNDVQIPESFIDVTAVENIILKQTGHYYFHACTLDSEY